MQLDFHQVDAFSKHAFRGNPAMVYRLDAWLGDELMQQIAAEHNLAETAFMVKEGSHWHIRWFTPAAEVPCAGMPRWRRRRCCSRCTASRARASPLAVNPARSVSAVKPGCWCWIFRR